MIYPKEYEHNLRFRYNALTQCERDKTTAAIVREKCSRDILFFFNSYLWAEDPFAVKGLRWGIPHFRIRPIITYPFQDNFILDLEDAIEGGEDFISDKSRDMLATYMVLGVFLHGWLFKGHKYLISSWKEDEVDGKEDTSTHFGKLRFVLKRLPFFLVPTGFDWKKNSSYMKLQNPENGGTLTGSAASPNLGSGRREDAIFFDELSKWEKYSSEAWKSASDATKTKIGVWTPRGSGNKAAELMRGDEVNRKHHLMWYLNPEKTYTRPEHIEKVGQGKVFDKVHQYVVQFVKSEGGCYVDQKGKIRSEWYDDECEGRRPDDIAENLDCNYLITGNPIFDVLKCEENKRKCVPPAFVGNLMWKIMPFFSQNTGFCINQDQLLVEFVPNINGLWKIWEQPVKGWENGYALSADVAEGLEQGDYDSASVLKRFDKLQVTATTHCKIKTFEYAEELAKAAVYYERAYIAVERNNTMGGATLERLIKLYNRLYHKEIFTKGYATVTDKLGWETTGGTKGQIIGNLGMMISYNAFEDNDEGFWAECLTFVNDDGKLEAQGKSRGERCYDDRVMDRAILFWISQQLPLPRRVVEKKKMTGWRKSWNQPEKGNLIRFV